MYKQLVRPLLFSFDSETIHHSTLRLAQICNWRPVYDLVKRVCQASSPVLKTKAFGVEFSNPLGLAAGFDKEARVIPFFSALGFGHVEIGTITPVPQAGNPRPRIFRLVEDQALINRMGFPSRGMAEAFHGLKTLAPVDAKVGANIGKNKETMNTDINGDYVSVSRTLGDLVEWITINVSSPNTPGLRDLQATETLEPIIQTVRDAIGPHKPLLVKLSPDLAAEDLEDVINLLLRSPVHGVIASNTTLGRESLKSQKQSEVGGLSGRPLFQRTLETVQKIHLQTEGKLDIVAVGGVWTAYDCLSLICSGASLVQAYSALVYEGPFWPGRVLSTLSKILESQGVSSVNEIIGDKNFYQEVRKSHKHIADLQIISC